MLVKYMYQQFGKALLHGRNDYPPKVRNILKKYGERTIQSITLKRTPVPSLLTEALSAVSFGKFGERLNKAFDELFHLFMEIQLDDGTRIALEKNEVINMIVNPKGRPKTESKIVTVKIPLNTTLSQLLEKTKDLMGVRDFFGYSARDNNCQDFIKSIFKANDIGDDTDIQFIKQDTKQLFDRLPYLRKFANTMTDLGARFDVLYQGAGILNEKNKIFDNNMEGGKIVIHHMHHHIYEEPSSPMEGGKVNIGRAFKKLGKDIKRGFEKEIIKPTEDVAEKAGDYITKKKGGLASDVITYGIPAASSALLGGLATAATSGNPVAGVAASAVGSKLGSMAAKELKKKTGTGMRKGRFAKGSPEAIAWGEKMRSMRKK